MSDIIMYTTEDGRTKIDVVFENENVWLTQAQMAELFSTTSQNITLHIKNIYKENELDEDSTCKFSLQVQKEGEREVKRNKKLYSLDMIISVGYRINSLRGTQFRKWATVLIKEYMLKGFAMNDELLKNAGGGSYWKELLERIRDIRSSEKMIYRQLLDLFATSVDYNPSAEECKLFFSIIQNKLHYAVNLQTAPELIYSRADSEKAYMGLYSFSGEQPLQSEIKIAKNYLNEKELRLLNRIVSAFFELAELHAENHEYTYMKDWIPQVDDFAERYGKGVLINAGKISHDSAIEKALEEYKKYKMKIENLPTKVEIDYLDSMKSAQKKLNKSSKGDN